MYQDEQPKGLYLLFFTELWERFGFYTLQAVLVLYMSQKFGFTDTHTYAIFATFNAMLYLTPIIGGTLADKFLGFQRCVIIGGIFFTIGYAIIGIPDMNFFYTGMSFVIIGNGLLKPSISSIVGDLYSFNDPRRDGGFTLFYMGINLGSLFPPLIVGTVILGLGWYAGFAMASLGMIIGLVNFFRGKATLGVSGAIPEGSPLLCDGARKFNFNLMFYIGLIIALAFFRFVFHFPALMEIIVIGFTILIIVGAFFQMMQEPKEQRNRLFAALVLILLSIGFWTLYTQMYTTMMLFTKRNIDLYVFGYHLHPEFVQFFNPFFIVIISPLLSHIWCITDGKVGHPSIPTKFTVGLFLIGFGYLVLGWSTLTATDAGIMSIGYLIGSIFILTMGELFVSPIGLSMVTRLAPKRLVGMMMGVWFTVQSCAFAIGGRLSDLAAMPKDTPAASSLMTYRDAFLIYGYIGLALTILGIVLIPILKKLIHIKNDQPGS